MAGDSVFRSITPAVQATESSVPSTPDIKPEVNSETPDTAFNSEGDSLVLDVLGVEDKLGNLPTESQENISEVEEYVSGIMKGKQLKTTSEAFKSTLQKVMEDMDIDPNTEPIAALDRMGGVIKGWKNLSFITDPSEKRKIFMKLARLPDSKSMNRFVYNEMNRKEVYA